MYVIASTTDTKIFNKDIFSKMKKGVYFINAGEEAIWLKKKFIFVTIKLN